jgi:putative endonuclease
MAFVYILQCADGTFYTGWTSDLERRFKQHQSGNGSKYVRSRLPAKLVYSKKYSTSQARKQEVKIKALTRSQKLKLVEKAQLKNKGSL